MRHQRDFSDEDSNHMLNRMDEFRDEVVELDSAGATEWITKPETGTGARIGPMTDISFAIYEEHDAFFKLQKVSMEGIPTRETCTSDEDFETKLNAHWKSVNRIDAEFHARSHARYHPNLCRRSRGA